MSVKEEVEAKKKLTSPLVISAIKSEKSLQEFSKEANISLSKLKKELNSSLLYHGILVKTQEDVNELYSITQSAVEASRLTSVKGKLGISWLVLTINNKDICRLYQDENKLIVDIIKELSLLYVTEDSLKNYVKKNKFKRSDPDKVKRNASEKRKKTSIAKYGVDNPIKDEDVRKRKDHTMQERYGTTQPLSNSVIREKGKKTMIERYGVEYPTQSSLLMRRRSNTNRDKWGVTEVLSAPEVRQKLYATNQKKYGSNISLANPLTQETFRGHPVWAPTDYVRTPREYNDVLNNPQALQMVIDLGVEDNEGNKITPTDIMKMLGMLRSKNLNRSGNPITSFRGVKSGRREEQLDLANVVKNMFSGEVRVEARPDFMEGLELDIYIPEYNFAIEFNGSYWHSDKHKNRTYHSNKTTLARKAGVSLLHIWEYDWSNPVKQDILKSQIAYKLHSPLVKHYYARKLELKQVDKEEANQFYDANHIQGRSNNTLNYGLYHEDELIACMGFGRKRFSRKEDNVHELIRFATKKYTSVPGGASRLFKHYLKENPDVVKVVSFSNDDFAFDSNQSVYTQLGFTREDKPSVDRYKWVNRSQVVVSRERVQTPKLLAYTLDKRSAPFLGASKDFVKGKDTERSYMERNGFYRVWNSSTGKYVYNR